MKHIMIMRPVQAMAVGMCLLATGSVLAAPHYVGSSACGVCHKAEYQDWKRSDHGRAMDLLVSSKKAGPKHKAGLDPDKDYTKDEKCLQCHTTGFKKAGGYMDANSTPDLAGVGCESCHGPGSEYRDIHKLKMLDFKRAETKAAGQTYATKGDKVCEDCHDHKDSPFRSKNDPKYAFDLKERLGRGTNAEAFHEINPVQGNHD